MIELDIPTAILGAFAASWCFSLAMTRIAPLIGFVDRPDNGHKAHTKETPLLGGLAVLFAVGIVLMAAGIAATFETYATALGVGLMCLLGAIDDRFILKASTKLMGQIAICLPLVFCLPIPDSFHVFGATLDLGSFAPLIMLIWLIGCTNAFNLLDGLDGMAGSVGAAISVAIAAVAVLGTSSGSAIAGPAVPLVVAASLVGFLCVNWCPARIYLGDAGSLSIGLLLTILAVQNTTDINGTLDLPIASMIFAVPMIDTSYAMARRWFDGRSIAEPDRHHFHHCLREFGFSVPRSALVAGGVATLCGVAAVAAVSAQAVVASSIACYLLFLMLAQQGVFGHRELASLGTWIRSRTSQDQETRQGGFEWEPASPIAIRINAASTSQSSWTCRLHDEAGAEDIELSVVKVGDELADDDRGRIAAAVAAIPVGLAAEFESVSEPFEAPMVESNEERRQAA